MENSRFISKGAASFKVAYEGPPKAFYFLLLPKLTMLAFSAAVEPLRIANQITNKELFCWYTMTEDGEPVDCSNGIKIISDHQLMPLPANAYTFVCAGVEPKSAASNTVLNWLRRQRAFGNHLGGICTGAFALAQAGVLSDRKFTLHWENQPAFLEYFPDLIPTQNLYENDRNLITCGGGNAATDMMLNIIETEHGNDLAAVVADMCIHTRSNNQDSSQKSGYATAIGCRNKKLMRAMEHMQGNIEEPMELSEIASRVMISKRQLERLFKKYIGRSPSQFYLDLRISQAHALLNETTLSATEIATATGFNSSANFFITFRKKYGASPNAYRKSWS
jgi:transcriptional regulator GlxA family with amidase domain